VRCRQGNTNRKELKPGRGPCYEGVAGEIMGNRVHGGFRRVTGGDLVITQVLVVSPGGRDLLNTLQRVGQSTKGSDRADIGGSIRTAVSAVTGCSKIRSHDIHVAWRGEGNYLGAKARVVLKGGEVVGQDHSSESYRQTSD